MTKLLSHPPTTATLSPNKELEQFVQFNSSPYIIQQPSYSLTFSSIAIPPQLKGVAVVTGYAGFIGFHFTKKLLEEGYIVYGIDKQPCREYSELPFNEQRFFPIQEDICNLKELPDCDYVFHFAAETHVHNSIQDCKNFILTNIEGTRVLLELIKNKPDNIVKKPIFCHISTDEVYGDVSNQHNASTEFSPLLPTNNYAVTKTAADLLVQSYGRTYGLEYIIVRMSNNYGTHQKAEKFIPLSLKLLLWGQKIRLHNGGYPVRSWIHVEDTVNAIMTLVENNSRGIFNIAGHEQYTNYSMAFLILRNALQFLNKPSVTKEQADEQYFDRNFVRPGQDMKYSIDDTKLRNLGWRPKYTLEESMQSIVSWYLSSPEDRLFK